MVSKMVIDVVRLSVLDSAAYTTVSVVGWDT